MGCRTPVEYGRPGVPGSAADAPGVISLKAYEDTFRRMGAVDG